jgi:hypothetical protein
VADVVAAAAACRRRRHFSKAVLHILYFSFYLFILFHTFPFLPAGQQTKPAKLATKYT